MQNPSQAPVIPELWGKAAVWRCGLFVARLQIWPLAQAEFKFPLNYVPLANCDYVPPYVVRPYDYRKSLI